VPEATDTESEKGGQMRMKIKSKGRDRGESVKSPKAAIKLSMWKTIALTVM
jgi:hypothetical protein